jgi:hypothetical protein
MLTSTLPNAVENMAVKELVYSTELVRTDGGAVMANSRWSEPLATWSVTTKPYQRNELDYIDTVNLFHAALGSGDTFTLHDIETCADVAVRFKDDAIRFEPIGNRVRLSFILEEVRS